MASPRPQSFPQTPKIAGRYKGDPRKAGDGVVEEGCAEAIPEDFFLARDGVERSTSTGFFHSKIYRFMDILQVRFQPWKYDNIWLLVMIALLTL